MDKLFHVAWHMKGHVLITNSEMPLCISKVMMHPNPGCGIIVTCQMRPFRVTVDVQLLVFPRYQWHDMLLRTWDVNGGWRFVLYKRSCIHYLGVGNALFLYIGQRTTSNSSSRGPCFNLWTSKSDLIKPMWFLFISNRHVLPLPDVKMAIN
jgi:hypothetical protein